MKKIKNAFTLLELLLVSGTVSLGGVALYSLYENTVSANNTNEELKRLNTYVNSAKSFASTTGNFNDFNINKMQEIGINVDKKYGLKEVFSTLPNELIFTYEGITSQNCTKFINKIIKSNMGLNQKLNNKIIYDTDTSIKEISDLCYSSLENKIVLTLREGHSVNTLTNESLVLAYDYEIGNPGSQTVGVWASPTVIPTVTGQAHSIITTGFKTGYTSNSIVPVPNQTVSANGIPNGSTVVGTFGAPSWDTEYVPPTPVGASIGTAEISFELRRLGQPAQNLITVYMNNLSIIGTGFQNLKQYTVEFSSRNFNLKSTNPVILPPEPEKMEEIFGSVTSSSTGVLKYEVTVPENVTDYFGAGYDGGSNQPVYNSVSLDNFFKNTFQTIPVYIDIINSEYQTAASTQIYPKLHIPELNIPMSLYNKNIIINSRKLTTEGYSDIQMYLTSYDGDKVVAYFYDKNDEEILNSCTLSLNETCNTVPSHDAYDIGSQKNSGSLPFTYTHPLVNSVPLGMSIFVTNLYINVAYWNTEYSYDFTDKYTINYIKKLSVNYINAASNNTEIALDYARGE